MALGGALRLAHSFVLGQDGYELSVILLIYYTAIDTKCQYLFGNAWGRVHLF